MSRIDEALRRAAEQAQQPTPERPVAGASDLDIEQLAREPYPLEMARRRSPAPPPAPVQESTPQPPVPLQPRERRALSIAPSGAPHAEKLVIGSEILPLPREQYRRLAGTLHHAQARARAEGRHGRQRRARRRKDADRRQPGADVQRVLPAQRAADRRGSAAAAAAQYLPRVQRLGLERSDVVAPGARVRARGFAAPGAAAGGAADVRSDGGSDIRADAPRDRGSTRGDSTG